MQTENQIYQIAINNANSEFYAQYATNPNFVATCIIMGNQECEIYLPKNKYRGQIARYTYRTMQIIDNPEPMVIETQHYPDRIEKPTSSHQHRSLNDVYKWTTILHLYLNHRELAIQAVQTIPEPLEPDHMDETFDDDFDMHEHILEILEDREIDDEIMNQIHIYIDEHPLENMDDLDNYTDNIITRFNL